MMNSKLPLLSSYARHVHVEHRCPNTVKEVRESLSSQPKSEFSSHRFHRIRPFLSNSDIPQLRLDTTEDILSEETTLANVSCRA